MFAQADVASTFERVPSLAKHLAACGDLSEEQSIP